MRSQTVKITDTLKVIKFTDTKLSDFNASYVRSFLEAQGAYIFSEDDDGLAKMDGYYIWFERNKSVFRLVSNSSTLKVDELIAGITMRASGLGSGTIAITDLAPYYYQSELRINYSGIGIFFAGKINVGVLHDILYTLIKY